MRVGTVDLRAASRGHAAPTPNPCRRVRRAPAPGGARDARTGCDEHNDGHGTSCCSPPRPNHAANLLASQLPPPTHHQSASSSTASGPNTCVGGTPEATAISSTVRAPLDGSASYTRLSVSASPSSSEVGAAHRERVRPRGRSFDDVLGSGDHVSAGPQQGVTAPPMPTTSPARAPRIPFRPSARAHAAVFAAPLRAPASTTTVAPASAATNLLRVRKRCRAGRLPGRILADQQTLVTDPPQERGMRGRVGHIHATCEHRDRQAVGCQRCAVRCPVDAERRTGHHHRIPRRQTAGEIRRDDTHRMRWRPVYRRSPRRGRRRH